MDIETITGAVEVVKTAVKRVDAFVGKAFGPAFNEFGGWLGDKVKIWRLLNLSETIDKVEQKLPDDVSVENVRRKLLAEWIDAASLEEDESLQDMWAGLLASAAAGEEAHPTFTTSLRQMTRLDALILKTAAVLEPQQPFVPNIIGRKLTELNAVMNEIKKSTGESFADAEIDVAIDNLSRLSLLQQAGDRDKAFEVMDGRSIKRTFRQLDFVTVAPTDLGFALLRLCSSPEGQSD
jgi:hypothetical protein